ncbi:hypothetical protein JNUCC64_18805 [Streptomyces sp. JNUCC 64]
MIREALLGGPPTETGTHCYVCGRWTTAPVVIGYTTRHAPDGTGTGTDATTGPRSVTHHVCPHHTTGDDHPTDHPTTH